MSNPNKLSVLLGPDRPKVGYNGGLLNAYLGPQIKAALNPKVSPYLGPQLKATKNTLAGDEELYSEYLDLYGRMPGSSIPDQPYLNDYMSGNPGQVVEFTDPTAPQEEIDPLQFGMTQEELDALHAKGLTIDAKTGKVIEYNKQGMLPSNLPTIVLRGDQS